MGETIEERGRHLGAAEDARPFAERQIGRDDHITRNNWANSDHFDRHAGFRLLWGTVTVDQHEWFPFADLEAAVRRHRN